MKKLSLFVMALLGVAFTSTVAMAQEDLCTPFFECLQGCGQDDQACAQECANNADPNVVQTYIAVIQCGDGAGCLDLPEEEVEQCIVENCSAEYDEFSNSCFGGEAPANNGGVPDGPCSGAFECLNSCEDAQCALDCANQAETADGQAAISDYVNCIVNSGCQDEACVQDTCSAEIGAVDAACFGGGGENNSSANNSSSNNAGNNSEPFNNSGNNSEGNNGGVISPGNNGDSGNNSNPVEDGNNGGSGNNSDNDGAGGNGGDEESEDGDAGGTTTTCSVSSLGGATTSGGAFLLLGLVVLGLRRRR